MVGAVCSVRSNAACRCAFFVEVQKLSEFFKIVENIVDGEVVEIAHQIGIAERQPADDRPQGRALETRGRRYDRRTASGRT